MSENLPHARHCLYHSPSSSRADFSAYLRSRGLSYKIWLARNPGLAPWEPAVEGSQAVPGTSTRVAAPGALTDEGGRGPPVAVAGLMLAIGCGLLLIVHRLRTVVARAQAPPAPVPPRRARAGLGARFAPLRRIGVLAASAVQGFDAGAARVSGRRPPECPAPGLPAPAACPHRRLAFALLAAIAAGMFVVFVTLLLTA